MGAKLAVQWQRLFGRSLKVLMLGLSASGKTTILYQLKLSEVVTATPTVGFNVEEVVLEDCRLTIWDVPLIPKALMSHYFAGTSTLIFVVDSSSRGLDEARGELSALLEVPELRAVPLLVLANKQDLPGAMLTAEVAERLQLEDTRDRQWLVCGCCALTAEGLWEGLQWVRNTR